MNRKLYSLGEALIDFIPETSGEALKNVNSFKKAPGGAPANVAASAAKMGCDSYFIGKVGDDSFGEFLTETLLNAGVKKERILKTKTAKTGLAFVSLQKNGERDFMFYRDPSADMLLSTDDITGIQFTNDDILHFGSVLLIGETAREATLAAITKARNAGSLISYDPNLRLSLWPDAQTAKDTILTFMPLADIVKISDEELEFLTAENGTCDINKLFTGNVKAVFLTMGSKGSAVYTKASNYFSQGFTVNAIDTTGAGDAFWGGILYKIIEYKIRCSSIESILSSKEICLDILSFANASGAIATTKKGAISSLPSREDVLDFMKSRN